MTNDTEKDIEQADTLTAEVESESVDHLTAMMDLKVKSILATTVDNSQQSREEVFLKAGYSTKTGEFNKTEVTKIISANHLDRNIPFSRVPIIINETKDTALLDWLHEEINYPSGGEVNQTLKDISSCAEEKFPHDSKKFPHAQEKFPHGDSRQEILLSVIKDQNLKITNMANAMKLLIGIFSTQLDNKFLEANLQQILKLLE